jgi:thiol-disulfide isomerase/thioredoxin
MKKCLLLMLLAGMAAGLPAQSVPVYKLPDLDRRMRAAGDTLLLVNFWATWCKPCVEEMPFFERLNQEYASQQVKVLFVSLDFKSQLRTVERFVEKRGIRAEVVLLDEPDYNRWLNKISPHWQGSIPATLAVQPEHELRMFREQAFAWQELEAWANELLQISKD